MFKHFVKVRESQGTDEYLGNIWGWKVSFIGLGVLGFLIVLYVFRIIYYPQPVKEAPTDKIEKTINSNSSE